MLSSFAISILFFAIGAILGIYLPLAVAFLVNKYRKPNFNKKIIWKIISRVGIIFFLYFILFAIGGFVFEAIHIEKQPESVYAWLGFGFIAGFISGIIFFIIGFQKGKKEVHQNKDISGSVQV